MEVLTNEPDRSVNLSSRLRNGKGKGISTTTSSTTTLSSARSSRKASLASVPSLFDAAGSAVEANRAGSQLLAFTTDELQLPEVGGVLVTPPGNKNKRKVLRPGTMSAIASSDIVRDSGSKLDGKNVLNNMSNLTLNTNPSGVQLRARPTVTTILRQQHVLEKAEKKEKAKIDSLMVSNYTPVEVDSTVKQQDEKDAALIKAAEAKRLLQAKLAYERAIAAGRKLADEKQRVAHHLRQKEKEWQASLEQQRRMDAEKRRAIAEQLQRTSSDSKRAVGAMVRYKHLKATLVKKETEQLQAEARMKQKEEEHKKQDRIQQIQAAKLALKRTKETMGNPNQFYRSIAIPETQIKLRLQKEEEKRKLQETRQKIQEAKQTKSVKLIRAMKKIQSFESVAKKHVQELQVKKSESGKMQPSLLGISTSGRFPMDVNSNFGRPSSNIKSPRKNGEIQEMVEELKRLRIANMTGRSWDQTRARSANSALNNNIRVIGTRNIVTGHSSSASTNHNSSTNAYRHVQQPHSRLFNQSRSNNKLGILSVGRH